MLLALPAVLFLAVLICVAAIMLRISFDRYTGASGEQSAWTLQNWSRLVTDQTYLRSLFLTLRLTVATSVLAVLLAFPLALFSRMAGSRTRAMMSIAMLLPLLANLVMQIVGWMVVFSPRGPLSFLPFRLAFTEASVLIVLVHHTMPFAYFAIDAALQNVPRSLEEAAATLGAGRLLVLRRVLFPLALPGVLSGSILVFAGTFSAFVIPILVGGYRVPVLGVLVQAAMDESNWPMSATIASALTLIALVLLGGYQKVVLRLAAQPPSEAFGR
jgi:putative spermidine/putrescine transport system permease protein